jgi:hypothetical protein
VEAHDGDTDEQLTYAVTAGNLGNTFAIDESTGAITLLHDELLDFELTQLFELTVVVTDSGQPARAATAIVPVRVADVNEFAPQVFDITFEVDEDSSTIGTVLAWDDDRNQSVTFTIDDSDSLFTIEPATGEIQLTEGRALDYELAEQNILIVTVTDNGTSALSGFASVIVNVRDVNEFSPAIANQVFRVPDDATDGWLIGTIDASDGDTHQPLMFSIIGGDESGTFFLDAFTGELFVADESVLDAWDSSRLDLIVQVTDSGNPPLASAAVITVFIGPVPPLVLEDETFSIAEHSPRGTYVGDLAVANKRVAKGPMRDEPPPA